MIPEERRKFLEEHRLAVVGLARAAAPPHLTPVYYVLDGDDILISTTMTRVKARLAAKAHGISVCVLGEQPPFPYLTISGTATIEQEGAADLMMRVGERMTGKPVPESMRAAIEERAAREQRVVLRVSPQSYYP